jgi:hypothetical protein
MPAMSTVTAIDERDRRRLGTILIAYGVLGLVLFVALAVGLFAAGSLLSDAPERASAAIGRVVAVLDSTGDTLASVESALGGAQTTLSDTAATIDGAATTLSNISGTLHQVGAGLSAVSILGAAPLAAVGSAVNSLGDQVGSIGTQIAGLSSNLTTNAADMATVAADLDTLQTDLEELRDALVGLDLESAGRTIQLVRYALLAIVAWLAVGSALLAWFGWRLRQPRSTA